VTDTDMTLAEVNRRLQRIENLLDQRIMTLDLFTAEKAGQAVHNQAVDHRVRTIEADLKDSRKLIMATLLAALIQFVFVLVALVLKAGGT